MDKEIKTAIAILLMEQTKLDLSDFSNSWSEIFGWVIRKKGKQSRYSFLQPTRTLRRTAAMIRVN
jgi:hypothetical protein